jgi:hypothetical protein
MWPCQRVGFPVADAWREGLQIDRNGLCPCDSRLLVKAYWNLPLRAYSGVITGMSEADQSLRDTAIRQRRLDLAKKAFREFYAQCFWSYREDAEMTENKIEFVIRGLREHGGLAGYQVAAELCH